MASILPFLLLFSLITLSLASNKSITTPNGRSNKEVMTMYEKWLVKHQKVYNGLEEKEQRFKIFKDNLKLIDEHNAQNHTYTLGLNEFADMTNEEYSMYLGTKSNDEIKNKIISEQYAYNSGYKLPESVDWRWAVGPIKHQGNCGACWAFSAVATVEAINKIVTGSFVNLSVQELVDCDRTKNKGCKGGNMEPAYEFIIENGGIDTEEDYPYKASDGTCDQGKKNNKVVSINSFKNVWRNNERQLMKAVANQPVSVSMDASSNGIKFYKSGVFTGKCETNLNHGVVIVGYGSENGVDYWLLRNSWGTDWGEDGYFKLKRNMENTYKGKCGIAMYPSYPVKYGSNSAVTINSALVSSA